MNLNSGRTSNIPWKTFNTFLLFVIVVTIFHLLHQINIYLFYKKSKLDLINFYIEIEINNNLKKYIYKI